MLPSGRFKGFLFGTALFFVAESYCHAQLYFRSAATGNWNVAATWESAPAIGGPYTPAIVPPNAISDFTITIRSPHTVTINTNTTIDETVVDPGATLTFTGATTVTMNAGPGVDLTINGTLIESSTNAITWTVGANWIMGANGSLIKTTSTSSNNWQSTYWGGISTIPATANWILRKTSGLNPVISTINAWYPNLTIENNVAGMWTTTLGSTFQGAGGFPTIKGNFDLGGSGTSTINFFNQHTNATPTRILGNTIVRTGNILSNYGTGLELEGDLTVSGTILYDANDARRIDFAGGNAQSISGTGTLNVFTLSMIKTANDVTLNRVVTADNMITFTNGKIISSPVNLLIINSNATVTGMSNASYCQGPSRKIGNTAFTFPCGKNNNYQPLSIGANTGGPSVFWTEDFGTGCNTGQAASSYSGPNGAWSITSTGTNDPAANQWFVSAEERGMGPGVCGAGCGGTQNRTLHLGATYPVIDPGAAYYESTPGFCPGFLPCSITDKRVESPTINCTGQSTITLQINYMEFGEGTDDNATLWYYDGTTWSLLLDLPKQLCCGNVTCTGSIQGLWVGLAITLPSSANNNPNVKIGFRWVNNGDGVGTDPSFAVDDIQLLSSVTDIFTCEYFVANPVVTYGSVKDPSLNYISTCEYWILDRNTGNTGRTVTLSWDGLSCSMSPSTLPDVRVARWDGTMWKDHGNGGTTGAVPPGTGTVVSAGAINTFSPFTLASITPLPVELISFNAQYNGRTVDINWTTLSEMNNDFFSVERAGNSFDFSEIIRVDGAGNSNSSLNYFAVDVEPITGVSYYRLRQTDFDGQTEAFRPVAVKINALNEVFIFPDKPNGQIIVSCDDCIGNTTLIELIDATGKTVSRIFTECASPCVIPSNHLPEGFYLMRISSGEFVSRHKIIY